MIPQRILTPAALTLVALLSFTLFPGRTWLQADTQIYVPILDHQSDPTLFARDEIALRPHVKFTFYDEITRGLRSLTGAGLDVLLPAQQLLTRLAGISGVYLLAQALSLSPPGALLAAAIFSLGATINGPAVLTLEYEPVPRGFAIMLVFGALGCFVQRRWAWAGALAVLATLYHPTTTAPFWVCLVLHLLLAHDRRETLTLEWSIAAAAAGLVIFAGLQAYGADRQVWIGRISPELERIQRLRGAYNWISLWPKPWLWQYPLLFGVVVVAWRRLRARLSPEARFLSLALPVFGLAMIPLQFVLLDGARWILMPQFQPARGVLFITAFATLLGCAAGWQAAQARRWKEACAWFAVVFAIPVNGLVVQLLTEPDPRKLAAVAILAALAVWGAAQPRALVLAALAPFILIPHLAGVRLFPALHTQQLDALSDWARASTPKDSVFLFPTVHRGLEPGVFRAKASRALYVDWKSGGQANLLRDYGFEWWRRWQSVNQAKPPLLAPLGRYRALGIDYLAVRRAQLPEGTPAAYSNENWAVVDLRPVR